MFVLSDDGRQRLACLALLGVAPEFSARVGRPTEPQPEHQPGPSTTTHPFTPHPPLSPPSFLHHVPLCCPKGVADDVAGCVQARRRRPPSRSVLGGSARSVLVLGGWPRQFRQSSAVMVQPGDAVDGAFVTRLF